MTSLMTVAEMIAELQKIEDKSRIVQIYIPTTYREKSATTFLFANINKVCGDLHYANTVFLDIIPEPAFESGN